MSRKPTTGAGRGARAEARAKGALARRRARRPGYVALIVLVAIQVTAVVLFITREQGALTALARRAGGAIGWTAITGVMDWTYALQVVPFFGTAFIGWAFDLRSSDPRPASPGIRWTAVAVTAAMTLICPLIALLLGATGGYTTARQVVWMEHGREVARHDWSQAVAVDRGCTPGGHRRSQMLLYSVIFSDGREARLGTVEHDADDLRNRLAEIARIDALLPPVRSGDAGIDDGCLHSFTEYLDTVEAARLRRLLVIELPPPS